MRGPIDYIIVGFEDAKFDGSVLKAVSEAAESGAINVLALSVVHKKEDGTVEELDIAGMDDDYIVQFTEQLPKEANLVSAEDIGEVGDLLEEGSAAGLLVVEQLWAKPLKKAIIDANGFLIAEGRIHPDASLELED